MSTIRGSTVVLEKGMQCRRLQKSYSCSKYVAELYKKEFGFALPCCKTSALSCTVPNNISPSTPSLLASSHKLVTCTGYISVSVCCRRAGQRMDCTSPVECWAVCPPSRTPPSSCPYSHTHWASQSPTYVCGNYKRNFVI